MSRSPQLAAGLAVLVVVCCLSGAGTAAAATRWVNDDGMAVPPGNSCNHPGYSTVQAAVNAASPGDRINVCPGTYTEEVLIPAGKNNLLLRSVQFWAAVIKAPAVMLGPTKSIVRVNGATGVTILAFTITGPGGLPCDSLRFGVRVDNGGSADILGNHITRIHDTPFGGCQNGVAVQVGRVADGAVGSARILGNLIDKYQKNGPTVSNSGSHADIAFNRILGIGPTAIIAQNGIQASGGATASIQHNFVAQNLYAPQTVAATGILLFDPDRVDTAHNTLTSNDVGIYALGASAGSTTAHNRARASTFDGIALETADGNRVAFNKSDQNDGPGIGIYDAENNAVDNNLVDRNQDSGIFLGDARSNRIASNHVRNNGSAPDTDTTDGIRVDVLSFTNTLRDNRLHRNVRHDCHDQTMNGNFWINNEGATSMPPRLCRGDDDDDDMDKFERENSFGWDADYAWYLDSALGVPLEAADYDWPAAYATVDTDTLLQLLPQIRVSAGRAPMMPFK